MDIVLVMCHLSAELQLAKEAPEPHITDEKVRLTVGLFPPKLTHCKCEKADTAQTVHIRVAV
jgi:hypothetical protein